MAQIGLIRLKAMLPEADSEWPYRRLEFDALATHGLTYFLPMSTGYFSGSRELKFADTNIPFVLKADEQRKAKFDFGIVSTLEVKLPEILEMESAPDYGAYVFVDMPDMGNALYIINEVERLS